MILPFKRYADFNGRSRRMEYWMYQVFTMLGYLVCVVIMLGGVPWSELDSPTSQPGALVWVGGGLAALWYLVTFIPDIAVTVRRFHDQDLSGWMYLIRFVPYVGWLAVMVFMFIDGQRRDNRYGPDPKNPYNQTHADIFA